MRSGSDGLRLRFHPHVGHRQEEHETPDSANAEYNEAKDRLPKEEASQGNDARHNSAGVKPPYVSRNLVIKGIWDHGTTGRA